MRWKKIAGWPDYEVSDEGSVRRVTRPKHGLGARREIPYLLAHGIQTKGYHGVTLCRGAGSDFASKTLLVHRLVAEAFIGPPPFVGAHAAHRNDDPHDNKVANIYWLTNAENAADRKRNGGYETSSRKLPWVKLTKEKANIIRMRYAKGGITQRQLARKYSVSQAVIRDVVLMRTWL